MGQPWRETDLTHTITVQKEMFADAQTTRNGAGREEF